MIRVVRRWGGRILRRARAFRGGTAEASREAAAAEFDAPIAWPPGHYYSPIPDLREVRARADRIFTSPPEIPGVPLEPERQLALVRRLSSACQDLPYTDDPLPGVRYHFANDFFGPGDAVVLQAMLRSFRPRRIVEVGSGFSSALILDTNERFLDGQLACTFIEPYPDRLYDLLTPADRASVRIHEAPVQAVDRSVFEELEAGDFLFVDSSHVSKVGSDVNTLVLEILPSLKRGVLCHFHDVAYPFEYQPAWVYEGRGWNEAYLLRAFLAFNEVYRVRLFNAYLATFHREEVAALLPHWGRNTGGSLWLEKTGC